MKKRFSIKLILLLAISISVINACSNTDTSEPQTTPISQAIEQTKQIIDTPTTVDTPIPFTPTPTQPPPSVTGYLPEGALRNLSRGEIYDIAVSPDGSQIAIGSVGGIYILDGNDYHEKLFVPSDAPDYMINSLDFSGDGANLVAVATFMNGRDQYLYLYQTNDYQLVKKIPFPRKVHYAPPKLAVSPIEPLVAVIVDGQRIHTWNYVTGAWNGIYNSPGKENFIWDIEFSPNGKLFIANEERVIAVDSNGKINNRYENNFNARVWRIAISNNGKLAAAYQDKRLVVWDVESGVEILRDEKLTFASTPTYFPEIVFSDDDQTLFIPNNVGLVSWNLLSGESNNPIKVNTSERNLRNELLQLLPNNRLLSVSVDQVLNIISLEQNAVIYTSTNFSASPAAFELSPDGNTLAISIGAGGDGNVVNFIDTNIGNIKNTFSGYQSWVSHLEYSPNSKYFSDGTKIFETDTLKFICNTGPVTFSSDEKYFSFTYNKSLVIAELPACSLYHEFKPSNEKSSFILSNDFSLAAENTISGEIKIYDVKNKTLKSTIASPDANEYQSLVFSDDNQYIAKSENRIMKTWIYNVETGEQINSLPSYNPFFIENKVFTFSKGAMNIWDLETGTPLPTVWLPKSLLAIDWVAISPDGNLISVSGFNYKINKLEIQILDVTNSKVLYKYVGHSYGDSPSRTIYLIFLPNSQELISIGPDGSILVWDTSH